MPDVLQIAESYRHQLKAEITKVEEFFCFAESLMKHSRSDASSTQISAIGQTTSPEQRADAQSRPPVNAAAATQGGAISAFRAIGKDSLIRGAFEAI